MHISGILVHAQPDKLPGIERALSAIPGVGVHAKTEDGRLIVTAESSGANGAEQLLAIHRIEGVLSAALVYHHFEPESGASDSGESLHETITA